MAKTQKHLLQPVRTSTLLKQVCSSALEYQKPTHEKALYSRKYDLGLPRLFDSSLPKNIGSAPYGWYAR